jgi:prepilin-type N-terminal cleavage/methylation domain-containing protein
MAISKSKKSRGFTLVELLVVIAIIALLLSILMPALGRVKNQAKIMTCAANAKQVGTVLAVYQNDNDGFSPVMLHKFSVSLVAAKAALLSLPFQRYSGKEAHMDPYTLNPDDPWGLAQVKEYSQNFLQKFYVCPFVRGSKTAGEWFQPAETNLKIGNVQTTLQNYKSTGLGDSFNTWIWPRDKGYVFTAWQSTPHPYGRDHGQMKYGNLQWHSGGNPTVTGIYPDTPAGYDKIKNNPVKFSKIPRLSERMAAYCCQGEVDESSHGYIINFGSHAKADKGGTDVIFGDCRVEWVQGSQITAGN